MTPLFICLVPLLAMLVVGRVDMTAFASSSGNTAIVISPADCEENLDYLDSVSSELMIKHVHSYIKRRVISSEDELLDIFKAARRDNVSYIFESDTTVTCSILSQVARQFDAQVYTYSCQSTSFFQPGLYRMIPSIEFFGESLSSMFHTYGWYSFAIFYSNELSYRQIAAEISGSLLDLKGPRMVEFSMIDKLADNDFELHSKPRVVFYVGTLYDIRRVLGKHSHIKCYKDQLHIVLRFSEIILDVFDSDVKCDQVLYASFVDISNDLDQLLMNFNNMFAAAKNMPIGTKIQIWNVMNMVHIAFNQHSHQTGNTEIYHTDILNATFDRNGGRIFRMVFGTIPKNGKFTRYFVYDNQSGLVESDVEWSPPIREYSAVWSDLYAYLWIILCLFVLSICLMTAAYFTRNRLNRTDTNKGVNKVLLLPEDLVFISAKGSLFSEKDRPDFLREDKETPLISSLRATDRNIANLGRTATFNGDTVWVKTIELTTFVIKARLLKDFKTLRDLRHENVNAFIGCYISQDRPCLVFDFGQRGSLQDIIRKDEIKLDWNFKWSMLNDVVRGMKYLHHSLINYHGSLKSRNCVVDSRWVLKITDYSLQALCKQPLRKYQPKDLLWTAPEHLRSMGLTQGDFTGSQAGDVYSFAIIMQEVILRSTPFSMLNLGSAEIIEKVIRPPPMLRPSVSKQAAHPEYINVMRECWAELPSLRPSFEELVERFKKLNDGKKVNIVDTMFRMLEQYSNNLEELIQQRTSQLEEEKQKTDKLLSEMLPPTVSEALKTGRPVAAESFECVTIYFSDIVGFTTISALSEPIQVVDLLNDLYTVFDSITMKYDCYKVETIGDAYMVVSGLPVRNGNNHAAEVATMALDILHHCGKFQIKHMPGMQLRVRIGIHSGPVVAGVVGVKMPRYCLFGDTVNTASRMESTGQAYRIHISQSTADILDNIGGFMMELRGEIELKGKGKHKTYWLLGKEGFNKPLPAPVESNSNHGLSENLVKMAESKSKFV